MTDDAKNLLRECLQYLYESAPAEVYDRITAHLAAPEQEPVGFIERGDSSGKVTFQFAGNDTTNNLHKLIPLGKCLPVFIKPTPKETK